MAQPGPFSIFFGDLGRSFRALRSDVRLPLISISLGMAAYLLQLLPPASQQLAGALSLVISLFYLGYVGTERVWFARLFHGESLAWSGIWEWTIHFLPRYFRLGLVVILIMSPLIIPVTVEMLRIVGDLMQELERAGELQQIDPQELSERLYTTRFLLMSFAMALVADFLLTFTTPALAFNHSKVFDALKENFRTIRSGWPASILYVLIPPFAVVLTLRGLPITKVGPVVYFSLTFISVFLYLLFKGATAAFYLREHPSADPEPASTAEA